MFPQRCWDFVAVDGEVSGGQVDHRFQADAAAVAEQGAQPIKQDGADLFDAGDAGAGGEGFFAEMNVNNGAGSGPVRIKRRRCDS